MDPTSGQPFPQVTFRTMPVQKREGTYLKTADQAKQHQSLLVKVKHFPPDFLEITVGQFSWKPFPLLLVGRGWRPAAKQREGKPREVRSLLGCHPATRRMGSLSEFSWGTHVTTASCGAHQLASGHVYWMRQGSESIGCGFRGSLGMVTGNWGASM